MFRDAIKLTLLILAAGSVYLIGNWRTQLFDRDEPRYAQCSRQMLQSGDWVVPRLYDSIRAKKPPGIYWCQTISMKLFGDTGGAARLPSALAMTLTLAVLGIAAWKVAGARRAMWAVFVLGSSGLVVFWSAKMCLTDAVLLLCIVCSEVCIYLIWRRIHAWPATIGLGIALGSGGMIKGPVILGVIALTLFFLFLLTRIRRRDIATPIPGARRDLLVQAVVALVLTTIIVVPWIVMVMHREPRFIKASTDEAIMHLENGGEGHSGPPGWHLLVVWGTYLPWSALIPVAIISAFKKRRDPAIRFALASVLGAWICAEVVTTKLPHYMLPAFPGLAFLTADAICCCLDGENRTLQSKVFRGAAVFIALVLVAGAIFPWWALTKAFAFDPKFELTVIAAAGIVFGSLIIVAFIANRPRIGLIFMGVATLTLSALLYELYFPIEQPLRVSNRVAQVLIEHDVVHPHQVEMHGYLEPSLAFYQGGTIREASFPMQPLGERVKPKTPWMVITRDLWDKSTPMIRSQFKIVSEGIKGLNYSDKLSTVEVLVVKRSNGVEELPTK